MIKSQRYNDCGVCAVANRLGINWDTAALRLFGAAWPRKWAFGTTTRQIAMALGGHRMFKLARVPDWASIPDNSIVKVIPDGCEGTRDWHWVVWKDGLIWDSIMPSPMTPRRYPFRLVSYVRKIRK